MAIELVSFVLCPFVQRSVITLKMKGVAYRITYIDLENPPAWFREISPLNKVPLLRLNGDILFESAIINEYLDEVYPPTLHPADPLERAKQRGWIEFGSILLFEQYALLMAQDEDDYQRKREALGGSLARVAQEVSEGPYFRGDHFSLLDAAYAPFFMRFLLLKPFREDFAGILPGRLERWGQNMLGLPAVKESVVEDFDSRFINFFKAKGSFLLRGE